MSRYSLTIQSYNSKTGGIPVSTSSADTCPDSCPLKKNGCYADAGPMRFHWEKVTSGERGMSWAEFCVAVSKLPKNQMWRHNQAGDLPGKLYGCDPHIEGVVVDQIDLIDREKMNALIRANEGKRGFTYTHKTYWNSDLATAEMCNDNGFTVNLSANNIEHADRLMKSGWRNPVTVVLPQWEHRRSFRSPDGYLVKICQATYRPITCGACRWCQNRDRDFIIGVPIHGSQSYAASVVCGYRPDYQQPSLF